MACCRKRPWAGSPASASCSSGPGVWARHWYAALGSGCSVCVSDETSALNRTFQKLSFSAPNQTGQKLHAKVPSYASMSHYLLAEDQFVTTTACASAEKGCHGLRVWTLFPGKG